jgi:hypothetical protein
VHLENVVKLLISHIAIIIAVDLLDYLHDILQFIILHNDIEQLRLANRGQNLLFTIEETQVAAVVHHVWVVGLLVHVHSIVELAKFHLHTHLTQSAYVYQNVLTVRISHKGLHESISIVFGVDSNLEIIEDLEQFIV